MPGKRDIAWICDKLVTQFKASLAAKFTALEAEYGDNVDLANIPTANYAISERRKIPGYPFVAVIPESTDTVPLSGENNYNIEYHDITVAIVRTDNVDEDVLKRQVLRSVRALEEIMITQHTLGGSIDDILIQSKSYGPMMSSTNSILQEGQISIRAMTSTNVDL